MISYLSKLSTDDQEEGRTAKIIGRIKHKTIKGQLGRAREENKTKQLFKPIPQALPSNNET